MLVFSISCFGQNVEEKCSERLKGCYCTDRYIDCKGAEFTEISEIYPYITAETYRIHITGGRIRSIPKNVFKTDELSGPLNEVVYLNMSGNSIEIVDKHSFQQLPNLKILDVSDNEISINLCDQQNDFSTSLAPLANIEQLYLRRIISKEDAAACDPGNIFSHSEMDNLENLDLSSNSFDLAGSNMESFLCKTYSLKQLNLSNNNFEQLPVTQCMINLVTLDLSNNQMPVLSPDEIDMLDSMVNLKALWLGGNPFSCDCYLDATYNWINSTHVPLDLDNIVCGGQQGEDTALLGKPIKDLKYLDFCGEPKIAICYGPGRVVYLSKTTFILGLSAGLVVLLTIITVVVFLCRRRRRQQRLPNSGISDVSKSPAYSRMV